MSGRATRRLGVLAFLLVAGVASILPSFASADLSHKFLGSFPVSEETPQVAGVDSQGRVYVFDYTGLTISRYNPDTGLRVPFPALESDLIDGLGGDECPVVKQDCDKVPGLGLNIGNSPIPQPAVAVSTAPGPTDGYIYAINNSPGHSRVEVFAPSGEFIGELDATISFPFNTFEGLIDAISVDANGHIYVSHYGLGSAADQFAPVDGTPEHDEFIGQLRSSMTLVAGGVNYSFGNGWAEFSGENTCGCAEGIERWPTSSWLKNTRNTRPISVVPDEYEGPFGYEQSCLYSRFGPTPAIAIDRSNEDAYLDCYNEIQQWSEENKQIGPPFGYTHVAYDSHGIGIDSSGGPNNGRLYVRGQDNGEHSIAVYSDEVPVPDIVVHTPVIGHEAVNVSADISLASGPEVTECYVEWDYGQTPCDEPTPYAGPTSVSVDLTGMFPENDYTYRFVAVTENGTAYSKRTTIRPAAVLETETGPATEIGLSTATLTGSLNADGIPTEYRFAYGPGKPYANETSLQDAGGGSSAEAVPPVELSELQTGRTYHYALVATNGLGTTVGPDRTFTTASAPSLAGVRATDVAATSAILKGRIGTFGFETSYFFEYGKSTEYGSVMPASPEDIGAQPESQEVAQAIEALEPGVTYHFRLVATNKWGTTIGEDTNFSFEPPDCPNSLARQQTNANYLPDCRAYELVSPGDAGAVQLFPGTIRTELSEGIARDPEWVTTSPNAGQADSPSRFGYFGSLGSAEGFDTANTVLDMYVSSRTPTGWVTTHPGLAGSETSTTGLQQCSLTMSICLDYFTKPFVHFGEWVPKTAPYIWDVETGKSLGRWPTNVGTVPEGERYRGKGKASPDFSHYVLSSNDRAFAPGGLITAPGSVYDNDIKESSIAVVSHLPDGSPIQLQPGNLSNVNEFILIPALSRDGSHILMSTASDPVCELQDMSQCPVPGPVNLYMTVDDSVSYDITHGHNVTLVGMTDDGGRVYFTSAEPLTGDDTDEGVDLFMWSETTDSLTRISQGNGHGDSNGCTANWVTGCSIEALHPELPDTDNAIARDNGDVYFYSPENLDADAPGAPNERNLYVYRDGAVHRVVTLDPETEINRIQVSPDGDNAAFLTASQVTGYDNRGFREMYRYRPDTGEVRCMSCLPSGQPPHVDVRGSNNGIFMSDDGRVAFSTMDPLVPTDTNETTDVYEFSEGRAQLISAGTGEGNLSGGAFFLKPQQTGLEAFSANGVDLYFSTLDTLTPEDRNGHFVKFYDARSSGGFPSQPAFAPCVAADECHGSGTPAGAEGQIASEIALGDGGNAKAVGHKKGKKAKRHPHRKRRHRHTGGSRSQSGGPNHG